ncbi:Predicted dehydrogenase [Roseibium denhamense]|uniref:Predicted dehydrogenase n=2 Tax=Roseibium denhamense TaxID=76305 RepID=A0ABY1PPM3_9HYPH|nr:Predicted dehydrogenase [Roseibium denhamense]
MARAYAAVLNAMSLPYHVAGRGEASAAQFELELNKRPGTGPFDAQLAQMAGAPRTAIVAASAISLAEVTRQLIGAGTKRLLVEKPLGFDVEEVREIASLAGAAQAEVYVAYNRRFFAATECAARFIDADGGPLSVKFDFTEASQRIEGLDKNPLELDGWFYGNSSHVIDLAFFLGGVPKNLQSQSREGLSWHPRGGIFTGHGETVSGAAICWHANWLAPGRWGVEIMTKKRRLIMQPMEQLFVQTHDSFAVTQVEIDDSLDKKFKPGLYNQVQAFLDAPGDTRLLSIQKFAEICPTYSVMRDGGQYIA